MVDTEIQKEIKDTNSDDKVDKSDLLKGLESLEPKEIVDSLNNAENKEVIKTLINPLVTEATKELKDIRKENLTDDQKDLLVLSARLNKNDITLPTIENGEIKDKAAYEKIATDELARLYPPTTPDATANPDAPQTKEIIEVQDLDGLKLYAARNGAPSPTLEDIKTAINNIKDEGQKTKIIGFVTESAKAYKDSKPDQGSQKIVDLQTYLIDTCKCILYGKNGGKDGMFGMGTYRAIYNIGVTEEKDKKDSNLADYKAPKPKTTTSSSTDSGEETENSTNGIQILSDGSISINDNNKNYPITKKGDFYERAGFNGKYELNGDKLYYVGSDYGLSYFDGTKRNTLNYTSEISNDFKEEIKSVIETSNNNEDLKNIIESRDLDYNGTGGGNEKAQEIFTNYIFKTSKDKNVIMIKSVLEGLKKYLKTEKIIDESDNIKYGAIGHTNRTKNNEKIEKLISSYFEKFSIKFS